MQDAEEQALEPPVRWTLGALSAGEPRVRSQARREALSLARALAAQSVALAADADADEYIERLQTLSRTLWPDEPLEGYALHSSLGAYLVAKVATGWTPPTRATPDVEPLDADGLQASLADAGLDSAAARAVIADWAGPTAGFNFAPDGLDPALLAGLAEQTLSRTERDAALNHVAGNPRCRARLATTCLSLQGVRRVLPVLPLDDEELGPDYVTAVAALALGRPERALALLGDEPQGRPHQALAELARAHCSLRRGEAADLEDDTSLPLIELETSGTRVATTDRPDDSDDEDAVLEFEEQVVSGGVSEGDSISSLPTPPGWSRPDWDEVELDETFIRLWREGRTRRRTILGKLGGLLGLRPPSPTPGQPTTAIPPDPRTIRRILDERAEPTDASTAQTERIDITAFMSNQQEKLGLGSTEPLFPLVRAALRAVSAAAEGQPPSAEAVQAAGDLAWVLQRARVLGLIACGDHDRARTAISVGGDTVLAEARWAQGALIRYDGRTAEPLEPEAARAAAAAIVAELGLQLGRTIAGTA